MKATETTTGIRSITKDALADYAKEKNRGFTPEISEDPVINLFTYYKIWFDWNNVNGFDKMNFHEYSDEYEKFRIKYDCDARYYNEVLNDPVAAQRGDTMISFYSIYKVMLKRATGINYNKCENPFDKLITKRNDPGYKEVNDKFIEFASLFHSSGNFMLLPHRQMNNARNRCSNDRIDKSLYECFPGGKLAEFFGVDADTQLENFAEWVKEQLFETMFINAEIQKENIFAFNEKNPFVPYQKMTDEELDEFLSKAVNLIKTRVEILGS